MRVRRQALTGQVCACGARPWLCCQGQHHLGRAHLELQHGQAPDSASSDDKEIIHPDPFVVVTHGLGNKTRNVTSSSSLVTVV